MQDFQLKSDPSTLLTRWRNKVFESLVKEKRQELMMLDEVKKFNACKAALEKELERSMYERR